MVLEEDFGNEDESVVDGEKAQAIDDFERVIRRGRCARFEERRVVRQIGLGVSPPLLPLPKAVLERLYLQRAGCGTVQEIATSHLQNGPIDIGRRTPSTTYTTRCSRRCFHLV